MKTVAIIGGGISGLISIKCCLDAGLNPVCFEMTNDIGGLWNYDGNAVDGKASVMKSTVINTSKEFMAFSDFPPPADYPNYMHNTKLLEYFRMYAEKFHLVKYVRFRRRVNRIEPTDDYAQTGSWLVHSINEGEKDEHGETCERFDAVMLATGHHAHPSLVNFEGLDYFKGVKMHSWQYKTPHQFENKNVLVIGIGNSAIDMAVELGRCAKQVYLSTRRGAWILNRVGPDGRPLDLVLSNAVFAAFGRYFPTVADWLLERDLNKRFDHEMYSLKPNHSPRQQHPSINDDLPNRIICGSVLIKPNIKEFTADGEGVIFEDDSKVDHIDAVLMATGFKMAFPYLQEDILSVNDNKIRLYKYIWPPHLPHGTLAVMGLVQPLGAINPITELQARWAVQIFKGERQLPSKIQMNEDIDKRLDEMFKRYVASPRHTIQVDYVDYCNELAADVGCRPNIFHYLFKDFKLACSLLFGPCTPYRYRLEGPNAWQDARQTILTQNARAEYPLRGQRGTPPATHGHTIPIPILSCFVLLILLLIYHWFF